MKKLLLLLVILVSSCKVYQVDYNTLPEEDKQKLHQQRYNSHVRIQSGWINNPFYWDNGYFGNWNGWNYYNRFQSPAIIIKRQPNKRNGRNNNTGYRGSNRPTKPVQNRLNDNTNNNIGRSSSGSRPNVIRRTSPKPLPPSKTRKGTKKQH